LGVKLDGLKAMIPVPSETLGGGDASVCASRFPELSQESVPFSKPPFKITEVTPPPAIAGLKAARKSAAGMEEQSARTRGNGWRSVDFVFMVRAALRVEGRTDGCCALLPLENMNLRQTSRAGGRLRIVTWRSLGSPGFGTTVGR
jgi:hypothetical protein